MAFCWPWIVYDRVYIAEFSRGGASAGLAVLPGLFPKRVHAR